MKAPLKILMIEDSTMDAELIQREIKRSGMNFIAKVVETKKEFKKEIIDFNPDVILSDHSLPQFTSSEAFEIYKEVRSSAPFILVTGTVSEEFAVNAIKNGVDDYILKNNLARLPLAIKNSIKAKIAELEKMAAQKKLLRSEIQIRNFATHLNTVLEDERARIAREIHDELGQQLTGIKLNLALFKRHNRFTKGVEEKINEVLVDLDNTMHTIRKIATELRPAILDTLGLIPAIAWISKEFEKKTQISCHFKNNLKDERVADKISTCLFRICQETLTNIAKHSEADKAVIEMKRVGNDLTLEICDNGKGMDKKKLSHSLSMGLIGIHERAKIIGADLKIDTKLNHGTSVKLTVALN